MCGTIKYCNAAEKTSVPKASQLRLKGQSSVPLYMQRWRSQPGFWPPVGSPCKGAPTAQTTQGAKDKGPRTCLSLPLTTLRPDLSGRKQAPYTAWNSRGNLTLREKEGPRNPCKAKVTPPPQPPTHPLLKCWSNPHQGRHPPTRLPGTHTQPAQPSPGPAAEGAEISTGPQALQDGVRLWRCRSNSSGRETADGG